MYFISSPTKKTRRLRSVILTDATVATVGLGLTIPIAFISDIIRGNSQTVLSAESLIGAFAVLSGFILVNVADYYYLPSSSSTVTPSGSSNDVVTTAVAAPFTTTSTIPTTPNLQQPYSLSRSSSSTYSAGSSTYSACLSLPEYNARPTISITSSVVRSNSINQNDEEMIHILTKTDDIITQQDTDES
jgi:hypothetical protein